MISLWNYPQDYSAEIQCLIYTFILVWYKTTMNYSHC